MEKKFKVILKKSLISCSESQRKTVKALGLSKVNSVKIINDTPATRGQLYKIQHLLSIEVNK